MDSMKDLNQLDNDLVQRDYQNDFFKTVMKNRVQLFSSNYLFHYCFPTSFLSKIHKAILITLARSSHPVVFLGGAVANKFIEITLWHGCSPVNLLHIFRTPFPYNSSGKLLLSDAFSNFLSVSSFKCAWEKLVHINLKNVRCDLQKQSYRGVLIKQCSENMQQLY